MYEGVDDDCSPIDARGVYGHVAAIHRIFGSALMGRPWHVLPVRHAKADMEISTN